MLKLKPVLWMGKEVGQLREDNLVFQTVRLPYHIYHKTHSVGISTKVLEKLESSTDNKLLKIIFILKLGNNKVIKLGVSKEHFKSNFFIVDNPDFADDKQLHIKIDDLCELNDIDEIEIPRIFQHEDKYN